MTLNGALPIVTPRRRLNPTVPELSPDNSAQILIRTLSPDELHQHTMPTHVDEALCHSQTGCGPNAIVSDVEVRENVKRE